MAGRRNLRLGTWSRTLILNPNHAPGEVSCSVGAVGVAVRTGLASAAGAAAPVVAAVAAVARASLLL